MLPFCPPSWPLTSIAFALTDPKPCPLLGVSDVGNPHLPSLGQTSISALTFRVIAFFAMAN